MQQRQERAPTLRAVVFDIGETLIDETTEYGAWADWLGVPRYTFSAMFGAVIALGDDYRDTFQHFRPGFDLAVERLRREEAGVPERFDDGDLYPDARPCLTTLKELGFLIGVAGNQTARAEQLLRQLTSPWTSSARRPGGASRSRHRRSSRRSSASVATHQARSPMSEIDSTRMSSPH